MNEEERYIQVGNHKYRRFIPYPKPVRDGTVRCITCGQIDEPEYHTMTCEDALRIQGVK